ncbi:MAG: hypothetical protein L6R35_006811 [Caloplaca aegaea]|nr:MAG: hypothetical protein L6R35_006811 [Caloplaca aegaea]
MTESSMPTASEVRTVTIQPLLATPTRSPSKRPIIITQVQKQALIDNLQLEITERARKLRAQYALQAQSLRARIELRVNRIPTAMRKAKMGELYQKYLESIEQTSESALKKPTLPAEAPKQQPSPSKSIAPSPSKQAEPTPLHRGTKRPSDHISADDDKENTPDPTHPLSTKKRPKPNTAHPSNRSAAAILSPKSSNARSNQQSPMRPHLGSPQKSYLSHPTSPLKPSSGLAPAAPKPASPAKAAAIVATTTAASASAANDKPRATRTRAAAAAAAGKPAKAPTAAALKAKPAFITRAKRGAEPPTEVGSRTVSAASNTSTGTTVVRKMGRGAAAAGGAKPKAKAKEGAAEKGVGKKGSAAAVEAPPQGRRVLRKRG